MQTRDEFRRLQKSCCPPDRGRKRRKQDRYGCPCCMDEKLTDLKRTARRWARQRLKADDRDTQLSE